MTALLTAAAIITTLALLASAANSASNATGRDMHKRGSWGIAHWTSQRSRALNPHERRWQTTLIACKDNNSRWPDLVDEIHRLERLSSLPLSTAPPKSNAKWIESRIAGLEANLAETSAADTSPAKPNPGDLTS